MADGPLDFGRFDVLTFDVYGTLIDWETGLADAFRSILRARGIDLGDDAVLERYAVHEAAVEASPYRRYREVLAAGLVAVCAELGFEPDQREIAAFSGSVADWPAFPDAPAALVDLAARFRLGVITNCDDDLFAASRQRLEVDLEWVVTAEQVGAYKPDERAFRFALERIGVPRERILHVAQSLYHDHVPAERLGLASAWINRRHGRSGSGATPPANARPRATYPDLATFAAAALA